MVHMVLKITLEEPRHTVGKCHLDRSGFDGPWTEAPLKFDNSYFTEMLAKEYLLLAKPHFCRVSIQIP